MKIGILVGSTRPGRRGSAVGAWVHELARDRDDADYELIELADYRLPLLDVPTVPSDARRAYADEATRAWSRTVDSCDGFVWITPEYNHGLPAAMKNAVDVLFPEWNHKTAGFVGYGYDGGTRAVEQWRGVLAAVFMHATRSQVALHNFADWQGEAFAPLDRRAGEVRRLLDQTVALTRAVSGLRS